MLRLPVPFLIFLLLLLQYATADDYANETSSGEDDSISASFLNLLPLFTRCISDYWIPMASYRNSDDGQLLANNGEFG